MLVSMARCWNFHVLLVEMQSDMTAKENSLIVSITIHLNIHLPYDPIFLFLGFNTGENENVSCCQGSPYYGT